MPQLYNLTEVAAEYGHSINRWIKINKIYADRHYDETGEEVLILKDGNWYGNEFLYTALQFDIDPAFRIKVIRTIVKSILSEEL